MANNVSQQWGTIISLLESDEIYENYRNRTTNEKNKYLLQK